MEETERNSARYILVATVGDLTEARVLAARLRSEGIEVRVHSEANGPYPVTVGQLAEAEIWVLSDRAEEASHVLLDAEVNTALAPAEPELSRSDGVRVETRLIAVATALVLILLWIVRFARVF